MEFVTATDPEAAALREELSGRGMDTGADGLLTANLWLWTFGPKSEPRDVLSALFAHPDLPYRKLLRPHVTSAPWFGLTPEEAHAAAVRLLTSGASVEVAAFQDELQAAAVFADQLSHWLGSPMVGFTNMQHRPGGSASGFGVFVVPHWVDEGLVLIGPERVGLLWFVGTD